MIDLKRTFRNTLKKWGHDVYIQRILPNGNHSDEFERVTTRSVLQSGLTNATATEEREEGFDIKFDAVYYFEESVNPKEGDRIYEDYSLKPDKNYTVYLVDTASPVRGRLGKINFWVAGATREK
jgi:hypothetical protein